jgi:hypothetical protein
MIAAHFFAGSLLTLFMPIGLVVAVIAYWVALLRRKAK